MPSKNPRITAVLEAPLYKWLKKNADSRGISISLMMRDIVREAYEREEEIYWARKGEERLGTFDRSKALTHEEVWGKDK
jgi:hypothetical protein